MKEFQKAMNNMHFSALGYDSIDNAILTQYSFKELKDLVTDCIRETLVDKSSEGIKSYLEYVYQSLFMYNNKDIANDILTIQKTNCFLDWLKDQINHIESGGAVEYSFIISRSQIDTKYTNLLEIIIELESELMLKENTLLPLIHLLSDNKVLINKDIVLWRLFVIIDIACSRGYMFHKEYLESIDRRSKDKVVRTLICHKIMLEKEWILSRNVSDSVRQSRKEYGKRDNLSSNYNDFSIKVSNIFDKITFSVE